MDKFVALVQVKLLLSFSACLNNVLITFASNTVTSPTLIAMHSIVDYSS